MLACGVIVIAGQAKRSGRGLAGRAAQASAAPALRAVFVDLTGLAERRVALAAMVRTGRRLTVSRHEATVAIGRAWIARLDLDAFAAVEEPACAHGALVITAQEALTFDTECARAAFAAGLAWLAAGARDVALIEGVAAHAMTEARARAALSSERARLAELAHGLEPRAAVAETVIPVVATRPLA